jgi:hypothetical protein
MEAKIPMTKAKSALGLQLSKFGYAYHLDLRRGVFGPSTHFSISKLCMIDFAVSHQASLRNDIPRWKRLSELQGADVQGLCSNCFLPPGQMDSGTPSGVFVILIYTGVDFRTSDVKSPSWNNLFGFAQAFR